MAFEEQKENQIGEGMKAFSLALVMGVANDTCFWKCVCLSYVSVLYSAQSFVYIYIST